MSGFAEEMPFFDEPNARPAAPSGIAARAMAARSGPNSAPDYLNGLNPEQRLAVETTEGPVLVLAGAGTGKTRVLTTRIAHILATGRAFPSQILAVTFTNKAAREMKQRIGHLVGEAVEGMPWLGTFHSIGVKLLRRHAELAGLKSDFTILDTDDVVRLIKQLIQAEGLDDKRWPAKQFAQMIDGWKNKGQGPADIAEGDARSFANGKGRELYKAYQERLKTLNACDFGDLLCHPIRIFRANPDVLKDYHKRFKYILVDEYQDTNTAQYMWLRLLAQRPSAPQPPSEPQPPRSGVPGGRVPSPSPSRTPDRTEAGNYKPAASKDDPSEEGNYVRPNTSYRWNVPAEGRKPDRASEPLRGPRGGPAPAGAEQPVSVNICCVGDDDQSIYGWRGAEVDNILRFDKDFPGATIIRLERNYRSTAHILGTASHLIAHNEGRFGKTLFTEKVAEDDEKVHVHAAWDSEEEARAVGETIETYQRAKHKLNDMAILVRASFQMREFEDRFVTLGLNYRVIGGPRFYERMEIRDALAFFRVVAQGADDLAFERIVNVPKRGLGEATIRQIHDTARSLRIPMLEAAAKLAESDELKPKPRAALREVAANFERWQKALETTPHTELAETILEESGYTDMWKNDRSVEAPGRLENLKELIRSMEEYESLRSFLEHVALVMDAEQNAELDAVNIMTLHSAKGLEFETVFLPGWEEGLFPHQRALDEGGRSGLEEERRLAYVGLTRAKKNLHLWFVSNRRIHGLWQSTIPSRFLDELPEAHVEVAESGNSYGGYGNSYGGGSFASGRGGQGAGRQNPYGASRFDNVGAEKSGAFSNTYATPGWQRAQANRTEATDRNWGSRSGHQVERIGYGETDSGYGAGRTSVKGRTIDGELVAKSVADTPSPFSVGDRVFHQKFGNGNISNIEGNKLTIDFDKAGQKRVLDGFVAAV
ncbi:UvrD-helicase domain-containing protein [Mesorhizobium sp. C416B]|uniref:ATP-dependent helicase n=1 Tax=unclassified Mesorhizobium TaxID=325217 RepID=UPI0003CDD3EB|nr:MULTISPECIES: UvrD-helicase domain-containing protein [unclassified Mesorhizobium]ESX45346.1 ATP-dependent DNA helicase [Mesorhizobium sp. LSHC426A00]ESX50533.1 ATP-dependent DNA helicase [Mesorhizobium sp. LSHC424B00]ESX65932.1 ATP-dependent DNA helicase [Mesorhizobium sp. LSHC416B00]ESX93294.1 ATP-dependent DNA helicase [Mesorhizobium sp. LNJC403B00]WJI62669.1 UvrD-helicase domain-containing protein [Mesorhizobium sp. C416B]